MDANPLTTPNNCLTNALNATIITFNGNEFVLQNDMGNGRVETAYLPSGYIPVGIKEYGGIIYIASYNPIKNQSQIGCFPSPERIISSDEVGIPTASLTDATFGLTEASNPGYATKGASSEYKKIEIFDSKQIFNPGDQFMIAIKQGNLNQSAGNNILKDILSFYGELIDYQDITIHLATLDDIGNITYIEKDLLKDPTSKYWMNYYDGSISTSIQDPDQYRSSIGGLDKYNIYKNKLSGHLVLIVELEGMENFDFVRKIDVLYMGQPSDISYEGEPESNYDTFKVTFTGSSNKYTERESADFNGYSFSYKLYEKDSQNNDVLIDSATRYRIDGAAMSDTPFAHELGDKIQLSLDASLNDFIISNDNGFKRNQVLKYEVTPFTDFLFLNRYKKSGIIDFSKVNTGSHNLVEWRYYVDNNNISIAFGFDYNPLEGYIVDEVYFEFYDIMGDYSIYRPALIRDNWSGNFTDVVYFNTKQLTDVTGVQIYALNNSNPLSRVNIPATKRFVPDETSLKKNNFYVVRLCIRETYIEDGITKYKNTNFFKYLYTTSLFNQYYIDNVEQDFQNLTPEIYAELITSATRENQLLDSAVETGEFFKIIEYLDPSLYPETLVTKLTANARASSTAELSSRLTGTNKDKFFGDYNPKAFNINFFGSKDAIQPLTVEVSNPSPISTTIDKFMSEEMSRQINDLADNKNIPYSSQNPTGSRLIITNDSRDQADLFLLGQVSRKVVGDTKESTVSYVGRKLEQFFKDSYFEEETVSEEMSKRIGGLNKVGGQFAFAGNAIGIKKNGLSVITLPAKNEIVNYKGEHPDDIDLENGCIRAISDKYFNNPVAMVVSGYFKGDDTASYRIDDHMSDYLSGQWPYASKGEIDGKADYNVVVWQGVPSTGRFRMINMGNKGWPDEGDWTHWNYGGRKYALGHALAKLLSNFYLVQKGTFTDKILISENLVYHNPFDTTFNIKIPIQNNHSINTTLFKFTDYLGQVRNFYNDKASIGNGLLGYLQEKIDPSYFNQIIQLNQNNIPTNVYNDINVINENNTILLNYKFGNTIRLTNIVTKFKSPQNAIITLASNSIIDENGSGVDSNNDVYTIANVYVKNPYVALASTGRGFKQISGVYPIDKTPLSLDPYQRGFFFRNVSDNDSNSYFVLGSKDGKKLVGSYSINGEIGVNLPLLDMNKGGKTLIASWTKGGNQDAPDLRSDLSFNDTYHIVRCSPSYASLHSNNRR